MNRIPKAVYTKEFREEAVKLAMTDGVSVSEAARRVSISMKTLANWVRAAKDGKLENVGQTQKPLTEIEALRLPTSQTEILLTFKYVGYLYE